MPYWNWDLHSLILLAFLMILSTIYDPYQSDQKKTSYTEVVRAYFLTSALHTPAFLRSSERSVRQHHFTDRAVLPGDGVPPLNLVVRGPDMTAVHSVVIVQTLAAFGLHIKSYTIFQEEKGFGA
jgi:hypothetical protein